MIPGYTFYRYEDLERIPQDLDRRYHAESRTFEQQHPIMRSKYESDMERARYILQHNLRKERNYGSEKLEKLPKATQTNLPPPLSAICQSPVPKPISVRQDSNVSSDSFSQTSSPSYTSKTMEAPLLPHKHGKVPGTFNNSLKLKASSKRYDLSSDFTELSIKCYTIFLSKHSFAPS